MILVEEEHGRDGNAWSFHAILTWPVRATRFLHTFTKVRLLGQEEDSGMGFNVCGFFRYWCWGCCVVGYLRDISWQILMLTVLHRKLEFISIFPSKDVLFSSTPQLTVF